VQKFAPNVTRGGIFLASRTPRPPGELFRFEVQLANGQVALSGEGKVIWVKEFNPDEPQKPHGMGVQFVSIDPGSRATLNQILSGKRPHSATPAGGTVSGVSGMIRSGENGRAGSNGAVAAPRVDTNVDLAAEFGLDEASLRRAVDRVRSSGATPGRADDDLETLQHAEASEPATLAQALAELPRLLDPTRRRSASYRSLEITAVSADRTGPITAPELTSEVPSEARSEVHSVDGQQPAHDESTR